MSYSYRHPALRQLMEQQTRSASKEKRIQQIDRAEALLAEVDPGRAYPYEFLCFRITGFRSDGLPDVILIRGEDLRHDLQLFVEDLSRTIGQPVEQANEPVRTVEAVSRRYNVSTRTVTRWRRQGLVARRFLIGGRIKVGFLESSLTRFVAEHREQVDRGTRFRQLTDAERDEIVHRARRMAAVSPASLAEIARRIARKMARSTETVRTTLKTYDREHPDRAIFPAAPGPLDEEAKAQIYRQFRRGVAAEILAKQFGRTRSSIYRIINEMRAKKILDTKLEFMPHPDFDAPDKQKAAEMLGPLPQPADGKTPRKSKPPKGLPPYLASLYEVPLLTREQEMHLFRKMNFLKHQANRRREKLDPSRAKTNDLDEIDRLQEEALAVKNQIIRANLRLVVSIAKRHVGPSNNFFELVSDGNMSLIRAVEKFDYARGNKFSTYASWAIMKNFARTIPEENYRRDRFVTGHEEMFEAAADNRIDEHEYESAQKRNQEAVRGMLNHLDDRERRIMISRFGLDGASEKTLEQLGRELGITKERVRQIESRAQDKLRKIAIDAKLELPML
ncbi:sigma-70 family RNA polymerase sigma factor [soil metagenome]